MDKSFWEKRSFLIVDDLDINRSMPGDIFEEQYSIMEAVQGKKILSRKGLHKLHS